MTPAQTPASGPIDAVYTCFGRSEDLRFSLRSLERNAPWIRKVYLVTDGQAPGWIDRNHRRLSVIRHEELFRDRNVPPNVNPGTIEWQLFRIPGLSQRFLYFHDDFFLGRRITPADFTNPRGGYRVFVEKWEIAPEVASTESLLNSRFGNRSPRKDLAHVPRFLDRSFLEEVNRLWERQIKQDDVSMETLYFYYLLECPQQFGAHQAVTIGSRRRDYTLAPLNSFVGALAQLAGLTVTRPKFFCLKQGGSKLIRRSAQAFLTVYFPRKCSFEIKIQAG